jgi:hypothetical protein
VSTAFNDLVAAVVAALSASPAVADGRVFANRLRPMAATHATGVVVRLEQTAARETMLGAHDWQTLMAVECYGKTVGATDASTAADDLLAAVWARLQTINAASLAVGAVGLGPQIEWRRDVDEAASVCAVVYLTVTHRTPVNTLEPWT